MRVAVTGATGHVGANVVRELLAREMDVRALVRPQSNLSALEGTGIETRIADVLDIESLRAAFQGCTHVIHLAGIISIDGDPKGLVWRTNVHGTSNVVHAAMGAHISRLVHVSSIHAFKVRSDEAFIDETAPSADDTCFAYDCSKAAGEQEVLAGVRNGLDAVILNPTGILGPHDHIPSLGGDMLRAMFAGQLPALIDAGFDWVDARDVATAICNGLTMGRRGERHLLCGHWASTAELAELANAATGHNRRRIVLPMRLATLGLPFLRALSALTDTPPLYTGESLAILRHSNSNCRSDKARAELGFSTRPLNETIADTHAWNQTMGLV